MARDFDGSSQYLTNTSMPATSFPMTMAAYFKADNVTGAFAIMFLGVSSREYGILVVNGQFWALAQDINNDQAISTAGVSTGTWYHGCGVFVDQNTRYAYINGANKGTDTNYRLPNTTGGGTTIGQRSTADQKFDGVIAECAIWDAVLSDAEIASLGAARMSPLQIRPQNLVFYCPLIGRTNPEIEIVGGLDMTLIGTPAVLNHPRIFYPSSPMIISEVASVPSPLGRTYGPAAQVI